MSKKKKKKNGQSDISVQSDEAKSPDRELDKFESLEKVFDCLFRNYTLYSQSIDDYIKKKKPSLRRRVIYHTITLNVFLASIIYLALYMHSARDEIRYLGSPLTYIFINDYMWFGSLVYSIGLMSIVFYRMSVFHYESRFQFIPNDNFSSMKVLKHNKLSKNHKNPNDCDPTLSYFVNLLEPRLDSPTKNTLALIVCCILPYNYQIGTHSQMIMINVSLAMFAICLKTINDNSILATINILNMK